MTDQELEAEIEDDVVIFATNRGWMCRKLKVAGRNGTPDQWFFKDGRLVIIEFKRPGDGKLRGNQIREIERYKKHGFHVHVIDNRDDACFILEGTDYVKD